RRIHMKKTRIVCALIPVFAAAGANAYYEGSSAYAASAFFGYTAGNQYFVEGGSGADDTFIRFASGFHTNDGSGNTFVGRSAGFSNTSGSNNTFLGANAGNLHQTGYNNTSLGALAGNNNSTGTGNVFVGYKAGYSEAGSNKLYVDNCYNGTCNAPLI